MTFDNGPSPSTLVAKTATVISFKGGHDDEGTSNSWLQIPLLQVEAEMTIESHWLSEVASENMIVKEVADPSIPFARTKCSYSNIIIIIMYKGILHIIFYS